MTIRECFIFAFGAALTGFGVIFGIGAAAVALVSIIRFING